MAPPRILAGSSSIGEGVQFGDDVAIEADELVIGDRCRIGFSDADDFRTPAGVRIAGRRVTIGSDVVVGRSVRIEGADIELETAVRVRRHSTVNVVEHLRIGAFGTVGESCEISGRHIDIGQELWMLPRAKIGGGSAFERASRFEAGHFLHLGVDTLVNTARPVTIGHEVGLGTRTSIYTHGAYPSRLQGFPVAFAGVEIGDFTWVPGAVINPGVRIGRNCIVGVNSLVTRDLPDGCLAAGAPAKVIREHAYPQPMSPDQLAEFFAEFLSHFAALVGSDVAPAVTPTDGVVRLGLEEATIAYADGDWAESVLAQHDGRLVLIASSSEAEALAPATTVVDLERRVIRGLADDLMVRLTNELRRYGIRFYSRPHGGEFVDWESHVPHH